MLPKYLLRFQKFHLYETTSWTYALHNIRSRYSILHTFAKTVLTLLVIRTLKECWWMITNSFHGGRGSLLSLPVCQAASVVSDSLRPRGLRPTRLLCPWNSPGKNAGVGCHSLLQGILPTQESNLSLLCLLHWQAGSFPLSHLGRCSLCYTEGQ